MENAEEVLEALKPHNKLKELRVRYYPGKQFPMWMRERQHFQYLRQIELLGCRGCEQLPPLEILPYLEYLRISEMDGIKHIVNNNSKGNALQSFPALKTLVLASMKNLEGWCVEEGREANMSLFPCLILMDIRGCPKLTTMPPIPTLLVLYMEESFCETQISLMSTKRMFFKHMKSLCYLKIRSCTEELVLLLEDEEETRAMKSSLEVLHIGNCNQLSLTLVLQNLTSIRKLSLNNLTINSSKNLPGASSLRSLSIDNCTLRELPMCPKSLQSLNIVNCPNLVSLSDGMQGLTSLQNLYIEYCPALKSFPEGLQQLLPTLKSLKIKGCPELERLCNPGGDYYNLLSTISYKRIGVLPKQTIQVPHDKQALKFWLWTTLAISSDSPSHSVLNKLKRETTPLFFLSSHLVGLAARSRSSASNLFFFLRRDVPFQMVLNDRTSLKHSNPFISECNPNPVGGIVLVFISHRTESEFNCGNCKLHSSTYPSPNIK